MGKRQDLSALDTDMSIALGRIIQQAFKHGIDCDIIQGGKLAAGVEQGLYVQSATQNYKIGSRRQTVDSRVFRYAKASADCKGKYGAHFSYEEAISYAVPSVKQDVGDTTITIPVAATDGKGGDGAIPKDELVGGFAQIGNAGDAIRQQRGIIGNTAIDAPGGSITITLDGPLTTAVVASAGGVEVIHSPYFGVHYMNTQWGSIIGVPPMDIAVATPYFWLQTWGPCCITCGSTTSDLGADYEQRHAVFDGEGAICARVDHLAKLANGDPQDAGFIIQMDSVAGAGPPWLMLQISP